MFGRKKVAAICAEFLGTAVLASAVLSMAERTTFPFFAAVVAGLTVTTLTLLFGGISGGHFNPAVTVGLWTIRKVETITALIFIVAQLAGGLVAFRLNEYLQNSAISNIAGKNIDWRIILAEAIGAMIFTVGFSGAIYLGYQGIKKAVTIGASLTMGILFASIASNGILNPAVAIGIHSFSFSYIVGPIIGALIGMNLFVYLFVPGVEKLQSASTNVATRKEAVTIKPAPKKTSTKKIKKVTKNK